MRYKRAVACLSLLFAACGLVVRSQQSAPANPSAPGIGPQISFAFDRAGLPVPSYRFTLQKDGSALYEGKELPPSDGVANQAALPTQPFHTSATVSPATSDRIFALAGKLDDFRAVCASKAKNIADTGTKTLTYTGPDTTSSCTYNYTENKNVQALTDLFQGIVETMDQGRQLDYLHRYDRLGLDAAITFLAQEVSEGRALEVGTIAPSLNSLAADPYVMERVRKRASALLTLVPSASQTP